jgi:hypothetical protein
MKGEKFLGAAALAGALAHSAEGCATPKGSEKPSVEAPASQIEKKFNITPDFNGHLEYVELKSLSATEEPRQVSYISNSNQGEYFLSENNSFFGARQLKRSEPFKEIKGINAQDIPYLFGSFVELENQENIENLLRKYNESIDIIHGGEVDRQKLIIDCLRRVMRDKYVMLAFKRFFEKGGRVLGVPFGGRYKEKEVLIGVDESANEADKTAVHEILHSVFAQFNILQVENIGGADHEFIGSIDARGRFLSSISNASFDYRKWSYQLADKWQIDVEKDAQGETAMYRFGVILESGDIAKAKEYLERGTFYEDFLQGTKVSVLHHNYNVSNVRHEAFETPQGAFVQVQEDKGNKSDVRYDIYDAAPNETHYLIYLRDAATFDVSHLDNQVRDEKIRAILKSIIEKMKNPDYKKSKAYIYTDKEIQDFIHLSYVNVVLFGEAFRIGIHYAEKNSIDFNSAMNSKEVRALIQIFKDEFLRQLTYNTHAPARALARDITSKLVPGL